MGDTKESKPEFTHALKCGHCGNFAPMKKVASYSMIQPYDIYDEDSGDPIGGWDEGHVFDTLVCPSCRKITFGRTFYNGRFEVFSSYEVLYPVDDKVPIGLPDSLQKAYEAAVKVRHIDANAYGVLIGRVLEMVCEDRKAQGKDLHSKLGDLAARREIPDNLVGVANGLRDFRNVGAHAVLGELSAEEVPILSSLAMAILEYVYSAPRLARMAQEKLDKLKNRRKQ